MDRGDEDQVTSKGASISTLNTKKFGGYFDIANAVDVTEDQLTFEEVAEKIDIP